VRESGRAGSSAGKHIKGKVSFGIDREIKGRYREIERHRNKET
jgi:hypothetical protein